MQNLELLDNLASALNILVSLNLLSQDQVDYMYSHLESYDEIQINSLNALIELAERVNKVYNAYNTYSQYPENIIQSIDDEALHPVTNIKEYLLKTAEEVTITVDLSSLKTLTDKMKFLPKKSLMLLHLQNLQEIVSNITIDNYEEVINQLFTMGSLIKLDGMDVVLERKLLNVINTIRLELEQIKVPEYSRFQDYLQTELAPSIEVLLARLIS